MYTLLETEDWNMSHPKVLACLVAVGGDQVVYYHVLEREKIHDLWFSESFQDQQRYSNPDSPAVNGESLMERIQAAESDCHSISMSRNCTTWYLKKNGLQIALIIDESGGDTTQRLKKTLQEISSKISQTFEYENDDIPLYILKIRCRSITGPILRRFNRKSTVK